MLMTVLGRKKLDCSHFAGKLCSSLILRGRARLCDFIKTQLKEAKKSRSCLLHLVNEIVTTSVLVFDDAHMGFCLFCACNPLFYTVGLVQYC